MSSNDQDLYAERTFSPLSFWRTSVGFLLLVSLYAVCGFLIYGRTLAFYSVAYLLIVGPFLLLPCIGLWLKLSGYIRILDLRAPEQSDLVQHYFEWILRNPGPEPVFYVTGSKDLSVFWMQSLNIFSTQQSVYLPEAWFHESAQHREKDFISLWNQMASLSLAQRRLRSFQMLMWCSAMFPLEVIYRVFQFLMDSAGFRDMPDVSFWSLRFFASLRNFLFAGELQSDPLEMMQRGVKVRVVRAWASPCLGVWALSPARYLHPLWSLLAHRETLLHSGSNSVVK